MFFPPISPPLRLSPLIIISSSYSSSLFPLVSPSSPFPFYSLHLLPSPYQTYFSHLCMSNSPREDTEFTGNALTTLSDPVAHWWTSQVLQDIPPITGRVTGACASRVYVPLSARTATNNPGAAPVLRVWEVSENLSLWQPWATLDNHLVLVYFSSRRHLEGSSRRETYHKGMGLVHILVVTLSFRRQPQAAAGQVGRVARGTCCPYCPTVTAWSTRCDGCRTVRGK